MNSENYSAFRFGFLSAQISRALHEYSSTCQLSPASMENLRSGSSLLGDIVAAQRVFVSKNEADRSLAPTYHELDAFNCALNVVLANREIFAVKTVPAFVKFFEGLHQTLSALTSGQFSVENPSLDSVNQARAFFERLAEAMLAEVSVPMEYQPDLSDPNFVLA